MHVDHETRSIDNAVLTLIGENFAYCRPGMTYDASVKVLIAFDMPVREWFARGRHSSHDAALLALQTTLDNYITEFQRLNECSQAAIVTTYSMRKWNPWETPLLDQRNRAGENQRDGRPQSASKNGSNPGHSDLPEIVPEPTISQKKQNHIFETEKPRKVMNSNGNWTVARTVHLLPILLLLYRPLKITPVDLPKGVVVYLLKRSTVPHQNDKHQINAIPHLHAPNSAP